MFCSECGNEIPEGKAFCPKCGAKQPLTQTTPSAQPTGETQPPSQQTPPPQQQIPLPSPVMRPPGTPTGRRNLWIVLSIVGVVIIIAAVIIVAVILGTGSSAQTPEQATNAFWAALKKKDFGGTWNMLSAEAQKAVGSKSNWEAALKKEFPENKAVVTVKAGKATINGNKATVTTTGIVDGKTETDTQHLLKENGVWKINVE